MADGPTNATSNFISTTPIPLDGGPFRYVERPSTKYRTDVGPSRVVLELAKQRPRPVLPLRKQAKTWSVSQRERFPLESCLLGDARAGKQGELQTSRGDVRYEGECMAGQPEGWGKLYVWNDSTRSWKLQYEGQFVRGRQEGYGTRHYFNCEVYQGEFVNSKRHGHGRILHKNKEVYEGAWDQDRRQGPGAFFFANGNIFTGFYCNNLREGLGTLYLVSKQQKYVAEYVQDKPQCGTFMNIHSTELEPLRGRLAAVILSMSAALKDDGKLTASDFPLMQLAQPSKVLHSQVLQTRSDRSQGGKRLADAQAASGTFSADELERLRHSFILMAGGDGIQHGLLPHQLRELCVMGGLDTAAESVPLLVQKLLASRNRQGRIPLDAFLRILDHFRRLQQVPDRFRELLEGELEASQDFPEPGAAAGEDDADSLLHPSQLGMEDEEEPELQQPAAAVQPQPPAVAEPLPEAPSSSPEPPEAAPARAEAEVPAAAHVHEDEPSGAGVLHTIAEDDAEGRGPSRGDQEGPDAAGEGGAEAPAAADEPAQTEMALPETQADSTAAGGDVAKPDSAQAAHSATEGDGSASASPCGMEDVSGAETVSPAPPPAAGADPQSAETEGVPLADAAATEDDAASAPAVHGGSPAATDGAEPAAAAEQAGPADEAAGGASAVAAAGDDAPAAPAEEAGPGSEADPAAAAPSDDVPSAEPGSGDAAAAAEEGSPSAEEGAPAAEQPGADALQSRLEAAQPEAAAEAEPEAGEPAGEGKEAAAEAGPQPEALEAEARDGATEETAL